MACASSFLAVLVLILPVLESLGGTVLSGGSSVGGVGERVWGGGIALEGFC